MKEAEKIYKYEPHAKRLVIKTYWDEMTKSDGSKTKDSRQTMIIEHGEHDIKDMMKELNNQRTMFEKRNAEMKKKLEEIKDLEVDVEFLEKLENAQKMKQKQQVEQGLENGQAMLKEVNKQIREVKSVIKDHIKF